MEVHAEHAGAAPADTAGTAAASAAPAEAPAAAATGATARNAVLGTMATLLEQRYLDVELGRRLATLLRDAAVAGQFDGADPQAFAQAVTQALRTTAPDLHLAVTYEPDREFVPGAGAGQRVVRQDAAGPRMVMRTGRLDGRRLEEIARTNFGLDRVERLDGFAAERGAVELHVAENRVLGVRDTVVTDPTRAHPKLAAVPMYILTSPKTASAAEMFAYSAHRVGRATLVGEVTAGAGNGGAKHSVGEGYALVVPECRSLTGSWERIGVEPDVEVAADAALDRALQLARERIDAS